MIEWRPVPGSVYFASNDGQIKGPQGKLLTATPVPREKGGHLRVSVRVDGRHRAAYVHRLVCLAFHGSPPFAGAQVRHLDGNPLNNDPDNLQWGTPRDNSIDAMRHNTQVRGEKHGNNKLSDEQVAELRRRHAEARGTKRNAPSGTNVILAREYGVCVGTINELVVPNSSIDTDRPVRRVRFRPYRPKPRKQKAASP